MNQGSTVAESDVRAAIGAMLDRFNGCAVRSALARTLHAVDPSPGSDPLGFEKLPVPDVYRDAVSSLFRSLGVSEGQVIPNALRAQVLQCLGFQEPPAPAWLRPGVGFFYDAHESQNMAIVGVGPDGVTLQSQDGRPREPIPMGLFLARLPATTLWGATVHGETVGRTAIVHAIVHAHVIDASGSWCTRCGGEPEEGSCVETRGHLPRNGGPCPGCATCRGGQPKPARHQVWNCLGLKRVVEDVRHEDERLRVFWTDGGDTTVKRMGDFFECIGVELDDGRHMLVGETWEHSSGTCTVVAVEPTGTLGAALRLRWHGERSALRLCDHIRSEPEHWHKVEEEPHTISGTIETRPAYTLNGIPFPTAPAGCPGCHVPPGARCLNFCPRRALPSPEGIAALRAFGDALVGALGTAATDAQIRGYIDATATDAPTRAALAHMVECGGGKSAINVFAVRSGLRRYADLLRCGYRTERAREEAVVDVLMTLADMAKPHPDLLRGLRDQAHTEFWRGIFGAYERARGLS